MPTTRTASRGKARSLGDGQHTSSSEEKFPSPRYRTRSLSRSMSECNENLQSPVPFSSLGSNEVSFVTPARASRGSTKSEEKHPFSPILDASHEELSPIVHSRESDVSREIIVVESVLDMEELAPEDGKAVHTETPIHDNDDEANEQERMNDLSSVRKRVGQSSNYFIERIRNAAHRRKVAMARSRDSLAAKEEQQLRSIAEKKSKVIEIPEETENEDAKVKTDSIKESARIFKARPIPSTSGRLGTGGLDGVPRVEKRPTTTPFSPMLGKRRPNKAKIKSLQAPKQSEKKMQLEKIRERKHVPQERTEEKYTTCNSFKARPIPKAVRNVGSGGQHGIPKVEKRPVTEAMSPLLGCRRRGRSTSRRSTNLTTALSVPIAEKATVDTFRAQSIPRSLRSAENGGQYGIPKVEKRPSTLAMSPLLGPRRRSLSANARQSSPTDTNMAAKAVSGVSRRTKSFTGYTNRIKDRSSIAASSCGMASVSPADTLLGLNLVTTPRSVAVRNEENITPTNANIQPYEPHSTRRAKKRAEYDSRRKTMFELKAVRDIKNRELDIRRIRQELNVLRQGL